MKRLSRLIFPLATVAGGIISLRFLSRRESIPCPSWLSFLLENPYTNGLAGAKTVIGRAGVEPGMTVLDAGCGHGRITVPLAKTVGPGGRVVALDIQPEMLQRAKENATAADLQNVEFLLGGIGAGLLPEQTFERAFLVTVLGEIPDREGALAEIFAALKPGGVLSVTELIPDPHYQPRGSLRRMAAATGFVEQSSFGNWLSFTLNFERPMTA